VGCHSERWLTLSQHAQVQTCDRHGYVLEQIISAPILVKAAQDVCYDSPIDGSPVTSWAARTEDLKRNGCRPYEPGMRQDHERQIQESEESLDKAIEQTVERSIEKMPTEKRGKLYNELTRAGVDAVVQR